MTSIRPSLSDYGDCVLQDDYDDDGVRYARLVRADRRVHISADLLSVWHLPQGRPHYIVLVCALGPPVQFVSFEGAIGGQPIRLGPGHLQLGQENHPVGDVIKVITRNRTVIYRVTGISELDHRCWAAEWPD